MQDYSRSDQIARHIRHNCPAFDGGRDTRNPRFVPASATVRCNVGSAADTKTSERDGVVVRQWSKKSALSEALTASKDVFQCHVCPEAFRTAWHLDQHYFNVHQIGGACNPATNSGLLVNSKNEQATRSPRAATMVIPATGLKCVDCSRVFASSSGLESHRRTLHNATAANWESKW